MCGGTKTPGGNSWGDGGLSPRVRGNLHQLRRRSRWPRSIPACAGEPLRATALAFSTRVYPRVCGGTRVRRWPPTAFQGLSPRVRGNHQRQLHDKIQHGSIPACAGEPWLLGLRLRSLRVYPRVCGGTGFLGWRDYAIRGLSPRVRGNRPEHLLRNLVPGSIPACAGEPRNHPTLKAFSGVYPRVCGGTFETSMIVETLPGLSPRVRGNLIRQTVT